MLGLVKTRLKGNNFNLNNKKNGFTLSEVLITLVIIGVVAAMSIPLLTANHKKQEYPTKLKKFYNTINEAIQRAENDTDLSLHKWQYDNGKELFEKLNQYIRYTKKCTKNSDDGTECPDFGNISADDDNPIIYLDDGVRFMINVITPPPSPSSGSTPAPTSKYIFVDLNGDALPNHFNKDIFVMDISNPGTGTGTDIANFGVSENNRITTTQTREILRNKCKDACNKTSFSDKDKINACFALIKLDGWRFNDGDQSYPCNI